MDDEIEQECLRALERCEKFASAWGLDVCVRSFEELGIPSGAAVGLYVSSPLPEWCEKLPVCAVDLRAALALSNPADRAAAWVAHELAHNAVNAFELAVLPECLEPPADELRQALLSPVLPDDMLKTGLPVWTGHCRNFIRGLSHVSWRLRAAGIHVCDVWSFPAGDYKLSPLAWYSDTLGPECEEMADLPIIEVMKRKSPAAFLRLWNEDLGRAAGRAAPEKNVGSSRRPVSVAHYSEEPSSKQS